jgi:hypothetical protein
MDGKVSDMKPVHSGVPQGSRVSPILWAYYTLALEQGLYEYFRRHRTLLADNATDPHLLLFVDDGNVYVSSYSIDTNVRILVQAFKVIQKWATHFGLTIDMVKKEIMHYSNRRVDSQGKGKNRVEHAPPITLPSMDPTGEPQTIEVNDTVKWLGIHFDRHLRFTVHIKEAAGKATRALGALRMLSNTQRGLRQPLLRMLFLSCILPIITYASPVWWLGRERGQKRTIQPLEKVLNSALR